VGGVFAVIVQDELAGLGGHHAAAVALQQGQPSSSSSRLIWRLTAEGTMPSFSAAARTEPQ
jgi:hypothetical protein